VQSAGSDDDEPVQKAAKSKSKPKALAKGKAKQVDDIDRSEEDNIETTSGPAKKGKGKARQEKSNKANKNEASLGSSTAAADTLSTTTLATKSLKFTIKPRPTPKVNVPLENEDRDVEMMTQDERTLGGARLELARIRIVQLNRISRCNSFSGDVPVE
jgi:hypothetical protein